MGCVPTTSFLFPLARLCRARGKRFLYIHTYPRVPYGHPRLSIIRRLRRRKHNKLNPYALHCGDRTSYCILNLACSAPRAAPLHKRDERKLRVLGCKPNQTHVLVYTNKPSPCLMFLCSLVLKYIPCLLFFCSLVLNIHPVLLSLCSLVLKHQQVLPSNLLTDKPLFTINPYIYSFVFRDPSFYHYLES